MRVQHRLSKEPAKAYPEDLNYWIVEYDGYPRNAYRYTEKDFHENFIVLSESPSAKYTLKLDAAGKVAGIANDDRDNVNSPKHYTSGHVETIYAIENVLGKEGFKAYCMGNYMKYMARHQLKNGEEDLKKAQVYLKWYTDGLPAPVNGKLPK